MKQLSAVHKYFWKYRYRFIIGIIFVVLSNYFAVLAPEITGYIVNKVQENLPGAKTIHAKETYSGMVMLFISWVQQLNFANLVLICSLTILGLALLRGFFMYVMRQTLIVMSRHIEYDMKNEVYAHYQQLDAGFFKIHRTGDLMKQDCRRCKQGAYVHRPGHHVFCKPGFAYWYVYGQYVQQRS